MCLLSKHDTTGSLRLRRPAFAAPFADQRRHLAIGLLRCACNRLPAQRHKREDEEDKQFILQHPGQDASHSAQQSVAHRGLRTGSDASIYHR